MMVPNPTDDSWKVPTKLVKSSGALPPAAMSVAPAMSILRSICFGPAISSSAGTKYSSHTTASETKMYSTPKMYGASMYFRSPTLGDARKVLLVHAGRVLLVVVAVRSPSSSARRNSPVASAPSRRRCGAVAAASSPSRSPTVAQKMPRRPRKATMRKAARTLLRWTYLPPAVTIEDRRNGIVAGAMFARGVCARTVGASGGRILRKGGNILLVRGCSYSDESISFVASGSHEQDDQEQGSESGSAD
mmetsp:Transcript_19174/g.38170  ORF Transcript_19174/g.38170 Transcript_19174/m.38170 type:complete len:247 (-) Transcript_19174:64-804(-)